jgi:hypothetical protein
MLHTPNTETSRLDLHVQLKHGKNAGVDLHMEATAERVAQPIDAGLAAILELLKVRGT